MTPAEFLTLVHDRTSTNDTTFTPTRILFLLNHYAKEFAGKINGANEDFFGMSANADLVAGQREYTLPSDMINKMKKLEVKFGNEDTDDYIPLEEIDMNSMPQGIASEELIQARFSNSIGNAKYELFRNSIFLYSGAIIDVEDGLQLWYLSDIKVFANLTEAVVDMATDTSTAHGVPFDFQELLARRLSMEYKSTANQPIAFSELEQKFEFDFAAAIETIRDRNLDRATAAFVPAIHSNGVPTLEDPTLDNGYNL